MTDAVDINEVIEAWSELKTQIEQIKSRHAEELTQREADAEFLRGVVLTWMRKNGVQNFRTQWGTPYRTTRTKINTTDNEKLRNFVSEYDLWGSVTLAMDSDWVANYRRDHDGRLPPGVEVREFETVSMRKSNG